MGRKKKPPTARVGGCSQRGINGNRAPNAAHPVMVTIGSPHAGYALPRHLAGMYDISATYVLWNDQLLFRVANHCILYGMRDGHVIEPLWLVYVGSNPNYRYGIHLRPVYRLDTRTGGVFGIAELTLCLV